MGLGGPVWHASVASLGTRRLGERDLRRMARKVLDGVGDRMMGEWEEWTGRAFHIRRRLAPWEQASVGPVVDIRGTDEARTRALVLGDRLSLAPAEVLAEELGTV